MLGAVILILLSFPL